MAYGAETVGRSVENLAEKMADLTNTVNGTVKDKDMGDIAGLLALMQGNNVTLRDVIREDKIADKTVARLEGFALRNYTPTRTTTTTDTTG